MRTVLRIHARVVRKNRRDDARRGARMTTRMRLPLIAGAACAVVALAASGAVAQSQSPWVVTSWRSTDLSQEDCLAHAEKALRNGGFRPSQSQKESRFGGIGGYTVLIRCVAQQNMIFFVASGPDSDQADKYVSKLEGAF